LAIFVDELVFQNQNHPFALMGGFDFGSKKVEPLRRLVYLYGALSPQNGRSHYFAKGASYAGETL